jgi:hypothetical protein
VSNLSQMKQSLAHLSELSSEMRGQLKKLGGPEGLELRESAKKQVRKIAVGAGISATGVSMLIGGALYIQALLIILFDLFMPLWAAALCVVLGTLFLGGIITLIGIAKARKAAKELPDIGEGVLQSIKETGDEMRKTVEELQGLAKREAQESREQAKSKMGAAKPVIPIVIGAFVAYKVIKRKVRKNRARRIILEEWQED